MGARVDGEWKVGVGRGGRVMGGCNLDVDGGIREVGSVGGIWVWGGVNGRFAPINCGEQQQQ